jgi:hypothetical protein
MFLRGGRGRFDQFGTMEGAMSGSEFLTNSGHFQAPNGIPVSLSCGYQSQDPLAAAAHRFSHAPSQARSMLLPFGERAETVERAHAGEVVGGNHSSRAKAPSLGAWSDSSSSSRLGGAPHH